jgi:hypothetical protein
MLSKNLSSEYAIEKRKTKFAFSVGTFITVFLLIIYFILAFLFAGNTTNFSSQSAYPPPCIDHDVLPATPNEVSMRVLNGTSKAGLANAVADALSLRGFSIIETDNADMVVGDTQIRFGANATASAYTVAGNFNEPTIILDDRTDGLIDIVIGRTFDDLVEQDLVSTFDRSKPITTPKHCKPVTKITPVAALEHNASLVPAYKISGVDGNSASPSSSTTAVQDDSLPKDTPESGSSLEVAPTSIAPTPDKPTEAWAPPLHPERS